MLFHHLLGMTMFSSCKSWYKLSYIYAVSSQGLGGSTYSEGCSSTWLYSTCCIGDSSRLRIISSNRYQVYLEGEKLSTTCGRLETMWLNKFFDFLNFFPWLITLSGLKSLGFQ